MDMPHRQQLATRIHLGLMRELGQGIDIRQMLHSAVYARDVLLVCQAYPGTELALLGDQFRRATAEMNAQRPAQTPRTARHRSGFESSEPPTLSTTSFDDFIDSLPPVRSPARRWLQPSTWFTR